MLWTGRDSRKPGKEASSTVPTAAEEADSRVGLLPSSMSSGIKYTEATYEETLRRNQDTQHA